MFNLRRAPFDDPRARKAVAMAIDQDAMMKTLFNGEVTAGRGILRDNSALLEPGVQQQPSYNQAEAQRLFDELAAEGKPVKFTFLTQAHATARKTAEYMQSRLNQYRNVHMEIEAVEIGAYITKGLVNRDFQAQNYGGWRGGPGPVVRHDVPVEQRVELRGLHQPGGRRRAGRRPRGGHPRAAACRVHEPGARHRQRPAAVGVAGGDHDGGVPHQHRRGIQLVNEGQLIMEQVGKTS
ncbi:ABC transporter substrate-binding protein [Yinghuangia aomiensis]